MIGEQFYVFREVEYINNYFTYYFYFDTNPSVSKYNYKFIYYFIIATDFNNTNTNRPNIVKVDIKFQDNNGIKSILSIERKKKELGDYITELSGNDSLTPKIVNIIKEPLTMQNVNDAHDYYDDAPDYEPDPTKQNIAINLYNDMLKEYFLTHVEALEMSGMRGGKRIKKSKKNKRKTRKTRKNKRKTRKF